MIQQFNTLSLTSRLGVIVGLILVLVLVTPIFADVPKPAIPQAKGDKCIADTDYMRRNHMDLLLHQRDLTMHEGIRVREKSLKNCLTCHAVYNKQKQAVSYKDKRHFCNSCHSYAAVKIDCFECHTSTPMAKDKNSGI